MSGERSGGGGEGKGASPQSLPGDLAFPSLSGPWRNREGGVPDACPQPVSTRDRQRVRHSSGTKKTAQMGCAKRK